MERGAEILHQRDFLGDLRGEVVDRPLVKRRKLLRAIPLLDGDARVILVVQSVRTHHDLSIRTWKRGNRCFIVEEHADEAVAEHIRDSVLAREIVLVHDPVLFITPNPQNAPLYASC